jgi:hypothetical protein
VPGLFLCPAKGTFELGADPKLFFCEVQNFPEALVRSSQNYVT